MGNMLTSVHLAELTISPELPRQKLRGFSQAPGISGSGTFSNILKIKGFQKNTSQGFIFNLSEDVIKDALRSRREHQIYRLEKEIHVW